MVARSSSPLAIFLLPLFFPMPSIRRRIEDRFRQAAREVAGEDVDPLLRPTADPSHGDYQANCALNLAKRLGTKPRAVAERIVAAIQLDDLCEPAQIAGPGFINVRLKQQAVEAELAALIGDERLGVRAADQPRTVVVDFSGPNLAKEMHVGHLRSTIIGDAISRVLELVGHRVHRINHLGDWGTQFGMLLEYVRQSQPEVLERPESFSVQDLEEFYKAAHQRFESEPNFQAASRAAVVALQSGEPAMRQLWRVFCGESLRHCHEIYQRLGVRIKDRGESAYQDALPGIVTELREKNLAVESEGAVCVFPPGFSGADDKPLPAIVQKRDGGYNYDTTDLAALRERLLGLNADRLIYITDRGQSQHFQMMFAIARLAGWVGEHVELAHLGFGLVQGKDRKRLRTREGGTVKLKDLLNEAEQRVLALLDANEEDPKRRRSFSADQKRQIARAAGVAAIKYADLSHGVESDYVFDWDKMVSLEGESGPYMMYAHARISGIGRKAGVDFDSAPSGWPRDLELNHPTEISLAKKLLDFPEIVSLFAEALRPSLLTAYLYDLSKMFSSFYDVNTGVRVIDAESESTRTSRLHLCNLTRLTLRLGLGLLGIDVVNEM